MKNLRCAMAQCDYNKGYCCHAKKIVVNASTGCTTFKENPRKIKNLFEVSDEFNYPNSSPDTKVGCKAHCIFNQSGSCCANGITVLGDVRQRAACATFLEA